MSYLEPPEHDVRGYEPRARHERPSASDGYPPVFEGLDFDLDLDLDRDSRPRARHAEPDPEPLRYTQAHPESLWHAEASPEPFQHAEASPEPLRHVEASPEPLRLAEASPEPPPRSTGRAGRNLPAALAVGSVLGGLVLASLLVWRPLFLFLVIAATSVGVWEMVRAVGREDGRRPPLVPLLGGCLVMMPLAWLAGPEALTLGLVLTVLAAMVWRLADGPYGYQRDLVASVLIAVYVPFLGAFAVLLDRPDDGAYRVLATIVAVVLSDTGGYVAGVFFGRHPMAPAVSPKKSWEGAAGSLLIAAAGGALMLLFFFHQPWWHGVIFGLGVAAASVLGDLSESLLKRDLGIKDMSNLLPGHGGLMDRLDSVLLAAPSAFALLSVLAPVTG